MFPVRHGKEGHRAFACREPVNKDSALTLFPGFGHNVSAVFICLSWPRSHLSWDRGDLDLCELARSVSSLSLLFLREYFRPSQSVSLLAQYNGNLARYSTESHAMRINFNKTERRLIKNTQAASHVRDAPARLVLLELRD